jgi:hypothetical protein
VCLLDRAVHIIRRAHGDLSDDVIEAAWINQVMERPSGGHLATNQVAYLQSLGRGHDLSSASR